jgi:hypothetical protein
VDLYHVCELFRLDRIPFQGLTKLLLSAIHLVDLHLISFLILGYISPEMMVTALSVLISLKALCLELQSPRSHPGWDSRHPPLPTRSDLPALTWFKCQRILKDLVARIHAPQLDNVEIIFLKEKEINLDTAQLAQFISHSPMLKVPNEVRVTVCDTVQVPRTPPLAQEAFFWISMWRDRLAAFVPYAILYLVFAYTFHSEGPLHTRGSLLASLQDDITNSEWLELLHIFSAVKSLYLSNESVHPCLAKPCW